MFSTQAETRIIEEVEVSLDSGVLKNSCSENF